MTDAEYNEAYHEWLIEEEALWEEDDVETLAWMLAIESKLGPFEDPNEYICRQDPENLVDSVFCADCPLSTGCFGLIELDIADARRKILDDVER